MQGSIDILVNNAAWDKRRTLDGLHANQWDHMMNVNIRHHFFAAQALAPEMKKRAAA